MKYAVGGSPFSPGEEVTGLALPNPFFMALIAPATILIHLPSGYCKTRQVLDNWNILFCEPRELLTEASNGECVVITLLGVDGRSAIPEAWQDFHECFKHLNIYLIFRDTKARW